MLGEQVVNYWSEPSGQLRADAVFLNPSRTHLIRNHKAENEIHMTMHLTKDSTASGSLSEKALVAREFSRRVSSELVYEKQVPDSLVQGMRLYISVSP